MPANAGEVTEAVVNTGDGFRPQESGTLKPSPTRERNSLRKGRGRFLNNAGGDHRRLRAFRREAFCRRYCRPPVGVMSTSAGVESPALFLSPPQPASDEVVVPALGYKYVNQSVL